MAIIGKLAAGALFISAVTAANAQLTTIGPFSGAFSEGFDTVPGGFAACVTTRVFSNTADLCTFNAVTGAPTNGAHATSGWSFGCVIFPHSGAKLFGSASGLAEYSFDTPISKFGGYFGTNSTTQITAGAVATFYDASGAVIGSDAIDVSTCGAWTWHGWQSTTPVKRIRVAGNAHGGAFVHMDDMTYDTGAQPCYPDCNGDGALNLADFGCFQTKFALNDPYADCNGDGVLNLADFGCFQTKFALGCP